MYFSAAYEAAGTWQ